jgi:hypothetical protein
MNGKEGEQNKLSSLHERSFNIIPTGFMETFEKEQSRRHWNDPDFSFRVNRFVRLLHCT